MFQLFLLTIGFSVVSAFSIALTGDRGLLSGDLLSVSGLFALVTNWRFILAMTLALGSRFFFVWINRTAMLMPTLSESSTTVTALVTSLSYPAILAANAFFLRERFSTAQVLGTVLIMGGIVLSCVPAPR